MAILQMVYQSLLSNLKIKINQQKGDFEIM